MNLLQKSNMDNHRLLASAALFRGMYSQNLSQYDVLAEFIKASVSVHNLYSFDVTTCTTNLKNDFGFEIPEAVVRNCIKSKLKQEFRRPSNLPIWERQPAFTRNPDLETMFAESQRAQEDLTLKLIGHVEAQNKKELSTDEKAKLTDDFISHLKGAPRQNQTFPLIGHFILSLNGNSSAKQVLENTRQGLIIFDGLRYSAEHHNSNLTTNLTIYLDTEVIFSAVGYHGELRRQLFLDFYNLVAQVNEKSTKNKDSGKILLRYFDDTSREIDKYFEAARAIVERRALAQLGKQAMQSITNGCKEGADVFTKRIRFDTELDKYKIREDEDRDYYDPPDFNIESQRSVAELSREIGCEPEKAAQVLKQFSRINYLRRGQHKPYLELAGFISLSDRNITRNAAFSDVATESSGKTVPFATDLDYMTERLWFKLNKGFSSSTPVIATFDLISRTRIVLSSQLANKVSDEYQRLIEEHNNPATTMSDEQLALLISTLSSKLRQPEEVTNESLDFEFLADDDFVARALEEHAALEEAAVRGRESERKLADLRNESERVQREMQSELSRLQRSQDERARADKLEQRRRQREQIKIRQRRALRIYRVALGFYWALPLLATALTIYKLRTTSDTLLSVFGTAFTVFPVVVSILVLGLRKKFYGLANTFRKGYLAGHVLQKTDRLEPRINASA